MRSLLDTWTAIAVSATETQAGQCAATCLVEALGATSTQLWSHDLETSELALIASDGFGEPFTPRRISVDRSSLSAEARVAETRVPIFMVQQPTGARTDLAGLAVVPLCFDGDVRGVLRATFSAPIDEAVKVTIQSLADAVASQIARIDRIAALEKRNAMLERMLDIREGAQIIGPHELRTPLTSLQLAVQSAQRLVRKATLPRDLSSTLARTFDTAERQCRRLTTLCEQLVDPKIERQRSEHPRSA